MTRHGKTSAGRQRWRCTACNVTGLNEIDASAKHLGEFLSWLLSGARQADMPGGGRSFRRRCQHLWEVWPFAPVVDEVHEVVFVDGIHLGRKAVVPQLHALYSIGMVVGAVVGSGLAHVGVGVFAHLVGLGVLSLAVVLSAAGLDLSVDEVACLSGPELPVPASDEPLAVESRSPSAGLTRRAWRERTTVLIALMVMSAGLMEGGASDWLSLSMVDGYRMTTAQGSAVLAFFFASLSLVRIESPRLERRFQPGPLLRMLLLCAVVGLLLVAFTPTTWLALVGVALWGAGAALGFPTGITALSVDPVMTLARVSVLSTVNYGTALIGPPVLGLIADRVGYHHAMAALAVPVLVAAFLTRNLPDRRLPAA